MATLKIKKGDLVKVIAGKDKEKEGKVIAVNKKKNTVLVEGINMITKHTKPSMANQQGGIVHQEGPIDISNVMYVHKGKATRIGFKMDGDKKVRFAKSTGDVID
ncbi:MAG: 50S ribosomal protein L24 [Lachnospiraceae bacterium]|nr:50S ribosomal protein L24 [Lachnospiraceae bacterium]MCI9149165.1 50S ribosomal protein L24 [Lachnospiraceae bacterium]